MISELNVLTESSNIPDIRDSKPRHSDASPGEFDDIIITVLPGEDATPPPPRNRTMQLLEDRENEPSRRRSKSRTLKQNMSLQLRNLRPSSVKSSQATKKSFQMYQNECIFHEHINIRSSQAATPTKRRFTFPNPPGDERSISDSAENTIMQQLSYLNNEMKQMNEKYYQDQLKSLETTRETFLIKDQLNRLQNSLFELGGSVDPFIVAERANHTSCSSCNLF